jgi:hypothetical protein
MAYNRRETWRPEDIEVVLVDEASEGDVATIKVAVAGAVLFIMGGIKDDGKRLFRERRSCFFRRGGA